MKMKNYFLEETNQNELTSKKHEKVCATLDYIKQLDYTITGFIWISIFASLIGIPKGITSSAIALRISAINAGTKKYKSMIKKKKNERDKIAFIAKSKLNSIEVLICKVLIHSVNSHD